MTKVCRIGLMLAAAAFCLTGCGASQSGQQSQATAGLTAKDAVFINRAGSSGREEVTFSQLAETRASNPTVRSLAASLVADFTAIDQQLDALTRSEDLTPPTDMDERHAALLQHLQTLNGPGFDRAYTNGQLQELTMVIQAFQAEADSGSDPRVRSLAEQHLPTLLERLQLASHIAAL